MIKSLKFLNTKDSFTPWAFEVKRIKDNPLFEFTDGINVLWGRNGSGKSTVLNTLAKYTHSYQGGVSAMTQMSVNECFGGSLIGVQHFKPDGYKMIHDGQPVRCFSSGKEYGVIGGGFDDFADQFFACNFTMNSVSSGQKTIGLFSRIFKTEHPKEYEWKISTDRNGLLDKKSVNDVWKDRIEKVEKSIAAKMPRGKPTIIMDEPDRSLDWDQSAFMWDMISKIEKYQVIVATHNPLALKLDANFIEFTTGYMDDCRKTFGGVK